MSDEDKTVYDRMPAGPDLDRLVAERVMGWEFFEVDYWRWGQASRRKVAPNPRQQELGDNGWLDVALEPHDNSVGDYFIRDFLRHDMIEARKFRPSQDICDAWEVIKKLCPTEGNGHPWFKMHTDNHMRFCANFHRGAHASWGDTAELAICRAALSALDPRSTQAPCQEDDR